jgi:iron complex transport system substrate-binding protein
MRKMKLKKIIAGVMVMAMCVAGFSGCSFAEKAGVDQEAGDQEVGDQEAGDQEAGTDQEAVRIIIDHTGAEVTLPEKIDRVVISSILPLPSVYCLFRGTAEDVVGIHPSSMAAAQNSYLINIFPELADADTSFVENGEVNIEQLLALEPDVVFYAAANTDERAMYDNAGIPAVGFSTTMADYDCVETYANWISLLGEIYGETDAANEIIEAGRSVAAEIKAVTDEIAEEERPSVLILFNYADGIIRTSGSGFFGEYWIETAGGRNVAADLKSTAEINMEQIYEWDPDIILITNFSSYLPEDLYNNTIEGHDWSEVSAVKNGQVYKFPLGMYRWFPPSSDTPLALKWLAKTIQPELFADMDMDQEIRSYYETYYGVTLTDDDIQNIYNPAREAAGQ